METALRTRQGKEKVYHELPSLPRPTRLGGAYVLRFLPCAVVCGFGPSPSGKRGGRGPRLALGLGRESGQHNLLPPKYELKIHRLARGEFGERPATGVPDAADHTGLGGQTMVS